MMLDVLQHNTGLLSVTMDTDMQGQCTLGSNKCKCAEGFIHPWGTPGEAMMLMTLRGSCSGNIKDPCYCGVVVGGPWERSVSFSPHLFVLDTGMFMQKMPFKADPSSNLKDLFAATF